MFYSDESQLKEEIVRSQLCTQEKLASEQFQKWAAIFGESGHMHRKVWEWVFICESLDSLGFLKPGMAGLGFAVGTEPLASVFASKGTKILATDLDTKSAQEKGWLKNNEHAANKAALNQRGLCPAEKFNSLVNFQFANMNSIPPEFEGHFDFTWSSCAFEHLGSLEHGIDFVCNAMKVLKPGGVAVHTTEFNACSNDETIETGDTVLYRKKDIEQLVSKLRNQGHIVEDMDWNYGTHPLDYFADMPPYKHNPHLKLRFGDFLITSIGIIIKRPQVKILDYPDL
ncbi:class I SAM-dependent methyltransferase [Pseudomonas azotifigens]|uniref:Class I SAM-dependent methyltransferase n=2 Tax=Stutzerimonas azotifigens TaxID=291995 RepID=A0ABR5Z3C7_9GAMM|nr:class I SAM-dependent methyltransferase [Stutzerimonas azotifigens]